MDHATLNLFAIPIFIFGTPGLERFEVLRKILSKGADGCIMVIDAVNPASIQEAKSLFKAFGEYLPKGTPIVIAANKQDIDEAKSPDEILKELNLENDDSVIGVLPTSALDGTGIDKTLKMIVLAVLSRYLYFLIAVREGGKNGIEGIKNALEEDLDKETITSMILWMGWRGLIVGDWSNNKFELPKRVGEIVDILEFSSTAGKLHK